jgi:hypothetical protein
MIAVVVAIAATVYVYVSGMIGGTTQKTSTITMNKFLVDDPNDTIIWLVAGLEGNEVEVGSYFWSLLADTGVNSSGASISFNDNDGDGYVTPGDTFAVTAGSNDRFVFLLTETSTDQTIFKSLMAKY